MLFLICQAGAVQRNSYATLPAVTQCNAASKNETGGHLRRDDL